MGGTKGDRKQTIRENEHSVGPILRDIMKFIRHFLILPALV